MGVMINTGTDVITFLETQHDDVKRLMEKVALSRGLERTRAFLSLRRALAVHETAEEEIVHPAARRQLPGGEVVVQARLEEENGLKKSLAELEKHELDSGEFTSKFGVFRMKVVAHMVAEERDELNRLVLSMDALHLARMRKAVELAEAVAPTRPHAGIESATANLLVGPFAAMVDRSRDALSGKR